MREEARLWFEQAGDDLKYAKANLDIDVFYICAFLSEQAAEKALKALYIEKKRKVPSKTHNLLKLGNDLKAPTKILAFLRQINPAYVTTRYPDAANGKPTEMFDKDIANDHLQKAQEVYKWVTQSIRQ